MTPIMTITTASGPGTLSLGVCDDIRASRIAATKCGRRADYSNASSDLSADEVSTVADTTKLAREQPELIPDGGQRQL
jgi:hypothetical protein